MAVPPRLNQMIHRFNQGCSFLQKAVDSLKSDDLPGYESHMRTAATEAIGALEWALKIYLRNSPPDQIGPEDRLKLKQPNFDDLMTLMKRHGVPLLTSEDIVLFYGYRDMFRNAAEHDAAIPASEELCDAIAKIRWFILTYLHVEPDQLREPNQELTPLGKIQHLKDEYFKTLQKHYEYMDLGGISPRVGSKVVKIRLSDLFIPLQAEEGKTLYDAIYEGFDDEDASEPGIVSVMPNGEITEMEVGSDTDELEPERIVLPHLERMESRSVSIEDMLKEPKIVVLGHPGSGKSTVGKYIAYSIATARTNLSAEYLADYIPIVIKAADYAASLKTDSSTSFYHYIVQGATTGFGDLFKWGLKHNQCLVIIDGLDEVAESQLRITTSRRIEVFVSEFHKNRFMITSRIVGYRQNQLAGDFVHFKLNDLDEQQALRFLEQWYKAIEGGTEQIPGEGEIEQKAKILWEAIESSPGVSKLAGNPLLLTIIALANWRGDRLPNKRVELYQIATETLVENWPLKQRGITLHSDDILAILEPVAFEIFRSGKNNQITEHDLQPLLESQMCEVKGVLPQEAKALSREMLKTIEVDTGFFLAKGYQHSQAVYGFLHLTFAEYLTARFLADQWSSNQLDLRSYVHDDRWHEVILLMAGHVGTWNAAQATRLVRDILGENSLFETHLHRDLLLAAEILEDNVRVKRELQDETINKLIDLALSTPHPQLWQTLIRCLSGIAAMTTIGSPSERLQSQEGESPSTKLRKSILISAINRSVTDDVLCAILESINADGALLTWLISTVPYVNILSRQEETSPYILFVQTTVRGFPSAITEDTAQRISGTDLPIYGIDSLFDPPPLISRSAARIWLLNADEVRSLGLQKIMLLLTSEERFVSFLVASALGRGEFVFSTRDQLVKWVLSDNPLDSRIAALDSLSRLWMFGYSAFLDEFESDDVSPKLMETINALVLSDVNPEIRAKALEVLFGRFGDVAEWEDTLRQALNDVDEMVRIMGARIASQRGDHLPEPTCVVLRSLLRDSSRDVRRVAAHAVIRGTEFGEEDVPGLLQTGFDQPPRVTDHISPRAWFADLLMLAGKTNSPECLSVIATRLGEYIQAASHLDQEDSGFYWYSNLSRPKPMREELIETASQYLNSSDVAIRLRAVKVWSQIRPGTISLDQWLPLLLDTDPGVRAASIGALHRLDLHQQDIIDLLLQALKDSDQRISQSAASALSKIRKIETRTYVTEKLVALLNQEPGNTAAFGALWNLILPDDELPF